MECELAGSRKRTGFVHGCVIVHACDEYVHLHIHLDISGRTRGDGAYLEQFVETASCFLKHDLDVLQGLSRAVSDIPSDDSVGGGVEAHVSAHVDGAVVNDCL